MNDAPIIKDFSLQDQNDKVWQLSTALQAGPVALISYRGKWCPFCIKTWLGLKKTQQDFARLGVQLIGLSVESPEVLEKWQAKRGLPFTFLSDPELSSAESLGIATTTKGHPQAPFLQPSFIIVTEINQPAAFYWASKPGLLNMYGATGRPSVKDMLNHASEVLVTS